MALAVTWAVTENAATPTGSVNDGSMGDVRYRPVLLTATGTYTAGGDSVTAAAIQGLTRVTGAYCNIQTAVAAGNAVDAAIVPQADGSVKVKLNAAAAEVANATTVTGMVLTAMIFGQG